MENPVRADWHPKMGLGAIGGRGMNDLAARLAHLNTLMQNIQARQVAGVELNASSGVELRPGRGLRPMQANMLAKGLAVFAVGACLATSAEARHRRSWQWAEPPPAASQSPTDATVDNERRQRRDLVSSARLRRSSGIAAVIDRVIRGCAQQGFELANWPFGTIAKVVAPDQDQAAALEELRIATQQAADKYLDGYVSTGRSSGAYRSSGGCGAGGRCGEQRARGGSARPSTLLREAR